MNKTERFIEKATNVHGDKYDYSKVNYINSTTKVCIICPKHGEFWQSHHNHLRGQGGVWNMGTSFLCHKSETGWRRGVVHL